MTSISLTSGNPSIASRVNSFPSAFAGSTAGTSSGGSSIPRLPGADFSKISPSFWLGCWRTFRIFPTRASISMDLEFNSNSSLNRAFENSLNGGGQTFNFGARRCLGHANERSLRHLGVMNSQSEWPDDFFAQEIGIHHFYRARKLEHEFVERRSGENAAHTGNFFKLRLSEARFREILKRLFAQPFFAKQAKVNRSRQRIQGFICANVRSSFFAADMLFASCQRENETSASLCVRRLAGEAAGHLAHVFIPRGDHADIRSSVAGRNAERLAFHGHNIGFRGRTKYAERNSFGNTGDKQRASGMRHPCQRRKLFDHAEKVWRLDHDSGSLRQAFLFQRRAIELAGFRVAHFFDLDAEIFSIGLQYVAIFGMHAARDKHAMAASEPFRHQHSFGERGRTVIHGGVGDFLAG